MQFLVIFLLLTSIRAQQNSCLCSCCTGLSCNPTSLPTITVQSCTLESCLERCRTTYFQCQGNHPNGYLSAICNSSSSVVPQFNCRCDCCNTGSVLCSPSFVGNSRAFLCETGSCSIACQNQYPFYCKADQTGLTQGTCISFITSTTTTTTTTTIGPWLGNTCACTYCQTCSSCPPTYVGVTSASYCSSAACAEACRNRYPLSCSTVSTINPTSGICISNTGGNTFCDCRCCTTNRCIDYRINTNGGCAVCDSTCRQYTPCDNTAQVTVRTCSTNNVKTSIPCMIFILIITIFTFFLKIN
jgi:hypothetical protein